jgi:hypothetical protein
MKLVRPILSVAVFVPGLALLGMFAAYDERFSLWGGAACRRGGRAQDQIRTLCRTLLPG